ncbi:MAG: dethiobiotin synthase [Limisphaerales bacterium]
MPARLFIAGTDTGVGKTVLTACLTRFLTGEDVAVRAVKPLASGGREDARQLRRAQGDRPSLDALNPWSFTAPLAPAIAAQREGRQVTRAEVAAWIRAQAALADLLLVEGAGGLLSPLGSDFDLRDLIADLRAEVILVAANRLGALNHVLVSLEALPPRNRRRAAVVLMSPPRTTLVSRTNADYLRARLGGARVIGFPWLGKDWLRRPLPGKAKRALNDLARLLGLGGRRACIAPGTGPHSACRTPLPE